MENKSETKVIEKITDVKKKREYSAEDKILRKKSKVFACIAAAFFIAGIILSFNALLLVVRYESVINNLSLISNTPAVRPDFGFVPIDLWMFVLCFVMLTESFYFSFQTDRIDKKTGEVKKDSWLGAKVFGCFSSAFITLFALCIVIIIMTIYLFITLKIVLIVLGIIAAFIIWFSINKCFRKK